MKGLRLGEKRELTFVVEYDDSPGQPHGGWEHYAEYATLTEARDCLDALKVRRADFETTLRIVRRLVITKTNEILSTLAPEFLTIEEEP